MRPHGLKPTRLLHPWDFPGKNTGVGCHFLLCFLEMSWNFSASRDRFCCQSLNSGNPQGLHKIKITDAQFPAQGSSLLNTKLVLLLGLSVMLKLTTLLTFFFSYHLLLLLALMLFCCPQTNFCPLFVCAKSCPTLSDCSLSGSYPWDFPGKNTGVGCHFLLQGIFPIREWNLGLLHYM